METKQDLFLITIKQWIDDYEEIDEHDSEYCASLKDSAYKILCEIKDSIKMGEL